MSGVGKVDIPDYIKYHTIKQCHSCQASLLEVKPGKIIERQVFEPGKPGKYEVTAHMGEVKICPCGCRNQADFPEGVTAAVQYGPTTQAMAVYPYFTYAVVHVLCNAHHLRELQGIVDRDDIHLALRMMKLLRLSWHYCKGFKRIGMMQMPSAVRERIEDIYDRILKRALTKEAACREKKRQELGRNKVNNTKAYNLFKRLSEFKAETLRYLSDFLIPFDNNGSERDARMAKRKQKISGCFRSDDGGSMFTRIRNYLSSTKKQGMNIFL